MAPSLTTDHCSFGRSGASALPCAGAPPPQRPLYTSRRRLEAAAPAPSLCRRSLTHLVPRILHCVYAACCSPASCRETGPLPHVPVGAGLVPALCPAKCRITVSPTAAAHSPPDPFSPNLERIRNGISSQRLDHNDRSKSANVRRNWETASRAAAAPPNESWPNAGYRSPPALSQLKTASPEWISTVSPPSSRTRSAPCAVVPTARPRTAPSAVCAVTAAPSP